MNHNEKRRKEEENKKKKHSRTKAENLCNGTEKETEYLYVAAVFFLHSPWKRRNLKYLGYFVRNKYTDK